MSKSKIETLCNILQNQHVMSESSLSCYHDARAVRNAARKKDALEKHRAIQKALKNYRVGVFMTSGMQTRVLNYATKLEIIL